MHKIGDALPEVVDDLRGLSIGPDAKGIRRLNLEEVGHLFENLSDLRVFHFAVLCLKRDFRSGRASLDLDVRSRSNTKRASIRICARAGGVRWTAIRDKPLGRYSP